MIRLPIFPPTTSMSKCYQLRVYEFKVSREVEPDVWVEEIHYGAGYWHFAHTKECDKNAARRSCGASGWLYWQDGVTIEHARANLAAYLLKEIRGNMREQYDRAFAEGPWNTVGLINIDELKRSDYHDIL